MDRVYLTALMCVSPEMDRTIINNFPSCPGNFDSAPSPVSKIVVNVAFMRSHPATKDRIEHTQRLIDGSGLPSGLKITDNGQLELIQRRIELLTQR